MDRLNTLPRNQVLKELQTYKKYQANTQKEISSQFSTIADLRTELYKLEKKSKKDKSIKKSKTVNQSKNVESVIQNIAGSESLIPNDILKETLLHSDLKTIINVCSASKNNLLMCNEQFWRTKFNHDQLPIIKKSNTFNEWVEQYDQVLSQEKMSIMLLKVLQYYNFYKGDVQFKIWYETGDKILPTILLPIYNQLLKENGEKDLLVKNARLEWVFTYNKKIGWLHYLHIFNIGEISIAEEINELDVLGVLLNTLLNLQASIDITDHDINTLIYERLLKKSKQNKPIPRAYLMAYQIMMDLKC